MKIELKPLYEISCIEDRPYYSVGSFFGFYVVSYWTADDQAQKQRENVGPSARDRYRSNICHPVMAEIASIRIANMAPNHLQ